MSGKKVPSNVNIMYSFSIRQFIWEYIGLDFFYINDSCMFGPNFILMILMFGGDY